VVGVSADSTDIARGIGERDGEAFSDRPKTGVSDDPGFDPPLSFDAHILSFQHLRTAPSVSGDTWTSRNLFL
jgi:hypothetical protein